MRQDRAGGFARDHGAHHIADGQRFGALLFGLALGGERIRRFSRLADADDQRAIVDNGVAIAEFAAVIHFHGNPGQPLDHEFAGQAGVPTGAAGNNLDAAEIAELLLGDGHFVEEDFAGLLRDAAQHGVSNGAGLLANLLEHEMLEAALFGGDGVPGDVMNLGLYRLAFDIGYFHALGSEHGDVAIAQEKHVAGVRQDAGNIAGHEAFIFAQAHDDRRSIAGSHDFARILGGENRQGVYAVQPLDGLAHGVFQRTAVHIFLHQMRHDLCVRLGDELVPFLFQFLLQLHIVFDDAIVDDHDLALAVPVGMGILFGGPPMRGPARVAQAVDAVDGMLADGLLEIGQLARRRGESPDGRFR